MQNCKIRIVALPYYEAGGCLDEFLVEAPGRIMTLRPEPTNEVDANAIRAYDWQGRHVGYVAQHDQLGAWQALRGSGRHSLRGRVAEVIADHKCVVFECRVEALGEVVDLYPQSPFLDWTYTGPVLKHTQEMETLEYMTDEICERLDERQSWSNDEEADFMSLTMRFCALSKYDISGEMSDYRRRLCLRLMETGGETFRPLMEELKMAYGRAGRETMGGEVLDYWMRVLSDSKIVKPLLVHREEYDLERIHKELTVFPDAMYEEWQENREHFVTKLLYMHIPRQVLWQLVSGIAFYEAMTARNKAHEAQVAASKGEDGQSPVYLKQTKGTKIDMIRVLNVLYEQGKFNGKDGARLTKKEFFITMGQTMNIDLSDYDKDLSRSLSDSTRLEKHTRLFDEMKQKMTEIFNSK